MKLIEKREKQGENNREKTGRLVKSVIDWVGFLNLTFIII